MESTASSKRENTNQSTPESEKPKVQLDLPSILITDLAVTWSDISEDAFEASPLLTEWGRGI